MGRDERDVRQKKEKRETKRPWGKWERYFVMLVILTTVGVSAVLGLSARKWKLPGLPRFKLPKISLERTYVIDGGGREMDFSLLESGVFEITRDLTGLYAVRFVGLRSGREWGFNDREIVQAASLMKLPLMALSYKQALEGELDLEETYELKAADKIGGSGSMYGEKEGKIYTYGRLLELMGKQSDNTAFNVMRKMFGDEMIQEYIYEIGMEDTSVSENETTAFDMGLFFSRLWRGELIGVEMRDVMLASLTDTAFERWMRAGIPENVVVSHKYGREIHVVNDAGIVMAEREPFVLVIMSDGVVEAEADEAISELARVVWEFQER